MMQVRNMNILLLSFIFFLNYVDESLDIWHVNRRSVKGLSHGELNH